MKLNKWTLGLAAAGVVTLASVAQAEEKASAVQCAVSSTTLSGYVDTSAIWGLGSNAKNGGTLPGRTFDGPSRVDQFNVHVVSLQLDKALDDHAWSAGYHVQTVFGPGVNDFDFRTGAGGLTGGDVALREAYVALRAPIANDLDIKVGQFATLNGYEGYDGYKQANFSRSYGFALEALSHVGVAASYNFNEFIGTTVGVANSYAGRIDAVSSSEGTKTYMALLTLKAPASLGFAKDSTLTLGYTGGFATAGPASPHIEQYYVGLNLETGVKRLAAGAAFDHTSDFTALGSEAYATSLYASFQATEKLRLNNRLEYTHGSAGVYSAGADRILADTITADYAVWKNVVTRGELRWDHSLNARSIFGQTGGALNGDRNNLQLALNVIYKF